MEVTFDSLITFEKDLRQVSRAASQGHGILRKSLQVFNDRPLYLRDAFWVVSRKCWSTVQQCGARLLIDTLIKLLVHVVGGASFLAGGMQPLSPKGSVDDL